MISKDFKTDVTLSRRIGDYKEAQSILYDDESIRVVLEPHRNSSMEPKMRIKLDEKIGRYSRHAAEEHHSGAQTKNVPVTQGGAVRRRKWKYFDAEYV